MEKCGFEEYFTDFANLISNFENLIDFVLLSKLESLVKDCDITGNYFNLEKGTRQYDPTSLHLFIFSLEVMF